MRLGEREAYSYRGDAGVPAFEGGGPVVFMDGDCALCTRGARAIARLDRAGEFRICPIQSGLGRGMLKHYGLDPDDPESWLYLADGKAYSSLDAVIRVGQRLGGWGHTLRILRILPRRAQDWLYRRIARNRYRLFGRAHMCDLADSDLRRRLLS
jgi:predicted DCC family thiol-disulfide oxidoreductase YuxK